MRFRGTGRVINVPVMAKSAKASKKASKPAAAAADPGMGDAAVLKATGKDWAGWFALLDAAGAATMKHAEIASLLHEQHGVPGWWCQMVTVGYERARGLREKHQTASGYQASASKTIDVGVGRVFDAWNDPKLRRRWLAEEIAVRKATPGKSVRITWPDGTHVEVNLTAKGEAKSAAAVQHSKLPDRAAVDRVKAFWGERLAALKGMLEG